MADFARGFDVFVESVLWPHFLDEFEGHLVAHAVVEGQVEPVLLGHFAPAPGALVGRRLGHLREELVLKVDFAQVAQVFGHASGLDRAQLAVKRLEGGSAARPLHLVGPAVHAAGAVHGADGPFHGAVVAASAGHVVAGTTRHRVLETRGAASRVLHAWKVK